MRTQSLLCRAGKQNSVSFICGRRWQKVRTLVILYDRRDAFPTSHHPPRRLLLLRNPAGFQLTRACGTLLQHSHQQVGTRRCRRWPRFTKWGLFRSHFRLTAADLYHSGVAIVEVLTRSSCDVHIHSSSCIRMLSKMTPRGTLFERERSSLNELLMICARKRAFRRRRTRQSNDTVS